MSGNGITAYSIVAGKAVRLVFTFIFGFWAILETGWLPEVLYAPLYPFWLPSYLAIALASSVRNNLFPLLGSGFLFYVAIFLFIYLEAVVLANLYRVLRHVYRTYQRGREKQAAS